MLRKLGSELTYANVMATVAVFLALGGGAIAAKALKKNSVGTKQLKGSAVTKEKLAANAVTKEKIAANAVDGSKIEDGSVGLADSNNSLHQKCPTDTVYIIGSCVDVVSQAGGTGVSYNNAEAGCAVRPGARLASAAELSSLVRGGFGTIPTPLFSWAFEATGGGEAEIVSNTGSAGTAAGATLHDYRCALNPLG